MLHPHWQCIANLKAERDRLREALQTTTGVSAVIELQIVADKLNELALSKSANTLRFWAERIERALAEKGKGT